ncbi:MAG: MBOAT family protein [Immundisolibacteraceae bacterium]|nr:MBOAT family protein [Immundisolibacteraceae bacterium]
MVFSSITFLYFFLPAALICYALSNRKTKNLTLLIISLLFYSWGEGFYVGIMILSIILNYLIGILIPTTTSLLQSKKLVGAGIAGNLFLLGLFKYSNFIADNINSLSTHTGSPLIILPPVHLPIGISFFTFQAISYLIDVHRKEVKEQKNIIDLGLYIALFPQLIAGPIVRYHDVAAQLKSRVTDAANFAQGIRRFLYGLSKKILIANPMGNIADSVFSLPQDEVTLPLIWLGAIAYTLQIYFDFSGYSDMAIGLGRMFGFRFLENFNYPYISNSIQEFWRRWHISLSSWFRDYLYIPLGGSRRGTLRTYSNLITIFVACGIWHGANWTFLIWGLYHGIFLILERGYYGNIIHKTPSICRKFITIIIVIFGWVIFRSDTFSQALNYIFIMLGFSDNNHLTLEFYKLFDNKTKTEILFGIALSTPLYPYFRNRVKQLLEKNSGFSYQLILNSAMAIELITIITMSYLALISLAAGVYNPFIYFRF